MNFITLDFETANSQRTSPCEIGITIVKDNKIIETKSWLVKPQDNCFDDFNVYIHKITPEMVENEPEFDKVWDEVKPFIENNFIIAHNSSFDISVLRRTIELYNISTPSFKFACSYRISRKVWPDIHSFDLKSLCRLNNIKLKHHRAGSDSLATAELVLKMFEKAEIEDINDLSSKLQFIVGEVTQGEFNSFSSKRNDTKTDLTKFVGDTSKVNTDSIFFEKTVVFTGTLTSMIRSAAQQKIVDIGGKLGLSVTKDTDILVVGQQDFKVVGEDGMSSKQEKAIKLIEKGANIEIVSENDFLQNT
jgi:DNA polymerase-3 subunit epsilon